MLCTNTMLSLFKTSSMDYLSISSFFCRGFESSNIIGKKWKKQFIPEIASIIENLQRNLTPNVMDWITNNIWQQKNVYLYTSIKKITLKTASLQIILMHIHEVNHRNIFFEWPLNDIMLNLQGFFLCFFFLFVCCCCFCFFFCFFFFVFFFYKFCGLSFTCTVVQLL